MNLLNTIAPPPQTTIADALTLLLAIKDPLAAKDWLVSVGEQVAELKSLQADVNEKIASVAVREAGLAIRVEQVAQAAAEAAVKQRDADAKVAALKAALAG